MADSPVLSNGWPTPADAAEGRYRRLVDMSPDAMCVHTGGYVAYVNSAGVRRFGAKSADELVGRMITDFVHADSVPSMLDRIASLKVEGDNSPASEATLLRLDGSPVEVEVVSVLTTWEGQPAYQVIFRDLTEQKAAETALRYQAALVRHASDAIIATTADGIVTSWNPAAEAVYRRSAARALGLPVSEVLRADVDLAAVVASGGRADAVHRAADGATVHVRLSVTAMEDGYVVLCSDYTAQRRAEMSFQSVVTSLHDGVVVIDQRGTPRSVNPAACRILGIDCSAPDSELRSEALTLRTFDRNGSRIDGDQPFMMGLFANAPLQNELVCVERRDGSTVWLSVNCCALDPADTEHSAMLVSFSDVTAEHTATTHLTYQAHHDPLTGLPNRAQIDAYLRSAGQSETAPLAGVMFVDLDNLKAVNDALGHNAGDTAIREAAHRLRKALREEDFLGRLGGDEFVVVLTGEVGRNVLRVLAARLHKALAAPLLLDGEGAWMLRASVGVTQVMPDDRRSIETILHDADAAMYMAKANGAGTHYA